MSIVLTDTGRQEIAKRMIGLASGAFATVGAGIGAGSPSHTDTALFTDANIWSTGVASAVTTASSGDTLQIVATLTATSGMTLSELGLAADSLHTLLVIHSTVTPTPVLLTGDNIVVTIKLVFS